MRNQLRYIIAAVIVIAGVGIIIATQGSSKKTPPSTTSAPGTTTTTKPSGRIAPLSGLPDPSGVALTRPALTVKIENDPNSHPQWGVEQADVVYEEIVNGGITRLAAIFNQNAPGKIGPVRSVRPTDTAIVWPLGGIFAYSGGAQYAINSISTAPVKLVDESAAGFAMYRDPNRVAPYNLYAITPRLFAFGGHPVPPQPLFFYRPLHQGAVGTTVITGGTPSVKLSGTISDGALIPTGAVTITVDGASQSVAIAPDGSFSATFGTGSLSVGAHNVSFAYGGDVNFTAASASGTLDATYGVLALFDQTHANQPGSTLPIQIALATAGGQDVSSSGVAVTALGIAATTDTADRVGAADASSVPALAPITAAGGSNPGNVFLELGGSNPFYQYNMQIPVGLAAGTYRLYFSVAGDPLVHWVTFLVG